MTDMITHWEKLEADAAECALIRDLATVKAKRELLAEYLRWLALEIKLSKVCRQTD